MVNLDTIETRYLGPTNTRGSRIKAIHATKTIIEPYDHGAIDVHTMAAEALLRTLLASSEVSVGTKLTGRISTRRGYIYTLGEKYMYKEADIIYENGDYWVLNEFKDSGVYTVMHNKLTHSESIHCFEDASTAITYCMHLGGEELDTTKAMRIAEALKP